MKLRNGEQMNRGKRWLIAASLLIGVTAAGMAAPGTHYKRELERTLREVTAAIQRKDKAAFASFLADDYTATDTGGNVMDRNAVIKDWNGRIDAMHDFKWRRQIEKLTVNGKRVETVTKGHLTAKITTPDKKDHDLTVDATTVDQWEKTNGKWLDHGSKLLKFVTKFDGKAVPGR